MSHRPNYSSEASIRLYGGQGYARDAPDMRCSRASDDDGGGRTKGYIRGLHVFCGRSRVSYDPNFLPRLNPTGSKPVLKDRCCDEMIDKRAPLPWVEAQDQPCRGTQENENGAPIAKLSTPPPQKAPNTTTIASRNLTVIYPHLGKKVDTLNRSFSTKSTTETTASDKIRQSKATTERPGQAPRSASLRQSMHRILDAARRMGLP